MLDGISLPALPEVVELPAEMARIRLGLSDAQRSFAEVRRREFLSSLDRAENRLRQTWRQERSFIDEGSLLAIDREKQVVAELVLVARLRRELHIAESAALVLDVIGGWGGALVPYQNWLAGSGRLRYGATMAALRKSAASAPTKRYANDAARVSTLAYYQRITAPIAGE